MLPIPYKGYPHKQFHGRIIDKNTRQPIPQATVRYDYYIFGFPFPKGTMFTKSMTDADGKFMMDPIFRYWNVFWIAPYSWGSLDENFLNADKAGYEHLTVSLRRLSHRINWILLDWDYTMFKHQWDLGDLEMTPATGSEANKKRSFHIDQIIVAH